MGTGCGAEDEEMEVMFLYPSRRIGIREEQGFHRGIVRRGNMDIVTPRGATTSPMHLWRSAGGVTISMNNTGAWSRRR